MNKLQCFLRLFTFMVALAAFFGCAAKMSPDVRATRESQLAEVDKMIAETAEQLRRMDEMSDKMAAAPAGPERDARMAELSKLRAEAETNLSEFRRKRQEIAQDLKEN